MKRRIFLQHSATVASALSVSSAMSMPNIISPAKNKLGIALVGLGYYSTSVLAPALQETEHVELRGIVTGTKEKEAEWMSKYGIPKGNVYNYENYDELADNKDIDIIYVVLPNSMHKEFTIRAARAGKHVICEKPMAMNAQECVEMIQVCREEGIKLAIGYRLHHELHTQEIMRLGQEKVFGNVRLINASAGFRHGGGDHWKVKKEMGGGVMMDMGVYPLQATRYVTGEEPAVVSAQMYNTRPEIEVDEVTHFQLEFPSGALANCTTTFHTGINFLKVRAEKGWFELEPFSGYGGIKGKTSEGPLEFKNVNQQATQMDSVALAIKNDTPVVVPGEEGLKDMIVVDAVYESLRTGKRITLAS